jgi:hypothetical protein
MATSDRDSRVESGPRTHVQPPPVQTVEASADDRSLFDELFGILPAWVISMILHMVAVLLAGMWIIPVEKEDPWITLSTSISDQELEGEAVEFETPLIAPPVEDTGKITLDPTIDLKPPGDPELKIDQPIMAVAPPVSSSPEAETKSETSDSSSGLPTAGEGGSLAGRNLAIRAEIVKREGGTSETEAAVAAGLQWLARHQNANGSWSLHAFHLAPKATSPPEGIGQMSDVAGTALALLPFLGAGNTPTKGDYYREVAQGLTWLVRQQGSDGDLRGTGVGRMYAHGQATIVLCEAYAMTGDQRLREPAQRAVNFIVKAQHPAGGWRYSPGEPGDTSVLGWQLIALRSGRMAYLAVPESAFNLAAKYLNRAKVDRYGGLYGYLPGHRHTPTMTAEALLCRQYLGWPKTHPGLQHGVRYLIKDYRPREEAPDIYYWYYGTQVMHNMGGSNWDLWNQRMRKVLVDLQRTDAGLAGSWDPRGPFADTGGRIYMTALAICCLEVYYRYMPMYHSDVVQEYKGEGQRTKDEGRRKRGEEAKDEE